MTARGLYTLLFGALMLVTSLSVSSGGAFLLGCAALVCFFISLLCVLLARALCHEIEHLDGHMFMEKVEQWVDVGQEEE